MIHEYGAIGEMRLAGETEVFGGNNAILSTPKPTLPDLRSNLGCCSRKPATIHLSYSMVMLGLFHSVWLYLIGFTDFCCCFESIHYKKTKIKLSL
jgi:hypothetical protein